MKRSILFIITFFISLAALAQTGVDTIHYRKVYYFAGTGLAFPLGKTKEVLSPKVFAGSMGLDISLKNPKYYVMPTLYMLSFNYDQKIPDPEYNRMIENGQSSLYMLSLAGGMRRQWKRLNTYAYVGPTVGLSTEPRSNVLPEVVKVSYKRNIAFGTKMGVGADYMFKGFFLGAELGYMYNINKIQNRPFQAITFMVGLKSDITKLSDKVVNIIKPIID